MFKILEGREYGNWLFNPVTNEENLCIGTIWLCEKCGKPATVNNVWLTKNNNKKYLELVKHQANMIKEKYGANLPELSCNDEGDNFCEPCYWANEKLREA